MSNNKQYLGDGVYADFDGYQLVLSTENGIETTNTIYLEPSVFNALSDRELTRELCLAMGYHEWTGDGDYDGPMPMFRMWNDSDATADIYVDDESGDVDHLFAPCTNHAAAAQAVDAVMEEAARRKIIAGFVVTIDGHGTRCRPVLVANGEFLLSDECKAATEPRAKAEAALSALRALKEKG